MNKLIFIIFLCVEFSVQGQFSLSAGMLRSKENFFGDDRSKFFDSSQLNLYNNYVFQVDYTNSFLRIYSEVSYLHSTFNFKKHYSYTTGGGSSPSYSDTRDYYSDVKIDYLTIKLGIGSNFKLNFDDSWWGELSYNFFGQYDRLLKESETNHVMYRRTSQWIMMTQSSDVKYYPPDYTDYDLIQFNDNIFQFGMEIKGRVGYENYFIELFSSLSVVDNSRWFSAFPFFEDENNSSDWVLNAGLKFGYYFKGKNKIENK